MRVTFTQARDRRYLVAIERERGPALVPRPGPGYDDFMPHDLAHFVVEEYFEIELGVWGQLAAGGGGIFTPAPGDNTLHHQRRARRIAAVGRNDMVRSEKLVATSVGAWESSVGRRRESLPFSVPVDAEVLPGVVRRLGEVAERWHALRPGGSLSLTWPEQLTFDPSKSRRGRR